MHDLTGVFLTPLTSSAPPENILTRSNSINPPFSSIPAHFLYSSFAPLETSTSAHWFLMQFLLDFYSFSRHLECWDLRHTFCSPLFFSVSWPELSWLSLCHFVFWLVVVFALNLLVVYFLNSGLDLMEDVCCVCVLEHQQMFSSPTKCLCLLSDITNVFLSSSFNVFPLSSLPGMWVFLCNL